MKVTIQEIKATIARKAEIESVPLSALEIYDGDKLLTFPAGEIDSHELTGLGNFDFIKYRVVNRPYTEEVDRWGGKRWVVEA